MLSTTHQSANILADLLIAHGVRNVVMSPGSRNAPIVIALSRRPEIKCHVVIDERSAAFIALGMSVEAGVPVVLVCTSGTALLNYAPAVAEAYYRHVPLIVVSADRPQEWIDQDDSQTLWQQNALDPYVKRSCDIQAHIEHANGRWAIERVVNDALLEAVAGRPGPVHINIRMDAPLNTMEEITPDTSHAIRMVSPLQMIDSKTINELAEVLASSHRVMIVAGFGAPDEDLCNALKKLALRSNIVVLTETISNLCSPRFISRIDATLCRMTPEKRENLRPDIVLTIGGALVSRHIKDWLRSISGLRHWHIGVSHTTVDCFKHLELRINVDAASFIVQVSQNISTHRDNGSSYNTEWHRLYVRAIKQGDNYIERSPWSTLKAMSRIIATIPSNAHLHLSNGTSIRYAQLMDCSHIDRSDCNRGVSGIDGSASTALGASLMYEEGPTVLITGDMSMQYDVAALSSKYLTGRFKIIVICNGGGEIFHFISATSALPEVEEYFAVGTRLPLKDLCNGYGIKYFEASDVNELDRALSSFWAETRSPALLAVNTPPGVSAEILRNYFK